MCWAFCCYYMTQLEFTIVSAWLCSFFMIAFQAGICFNLTFRPRVVLCMHELNSRYIVVCVCVCAYVWYVKVFNFDVALVCQAVPGKDGKGAVPDRDQRPAGPAVGNAWRAWLSEEDSCWWRERHAYSGNTRCSLSVRWQNYFNEQLPSQPYYRKQVWNCICHTIMLH